MVYLLINSVSKYLNLLKQFRYNLIKIIFLASPPKPLPKCGADFLDKIPLCPCNNDKPTHECFPLDEPNCARNCKHIIQCRKFNL